MFFRTLCLQETLENVKKCRNFLSTLIKLTSNGKQSSETTANVKELIKKLLVDLPSHPSAFLSSVMYAAFSCGVRVFRIHLFSSVIRKPK